MLALRLARRDIRGGLRHVRAALVGLAIGVAAIAAVGSLHRALEVGLAEGGRAILGGDVAFRLALAPAPEVELAYLANAGDVSAATELYAMARLMDGADPVLAAVKVVDQRYPLYGAVALDPPLAIAEALGVRAGLPGVVVARGLAERLGARVGDRLRLGSAEVTVRAILVEEPDRASAPFLLGERLIVGAAGAAAAGLMQPGSLARFAYRVRLPDGADPDAFVAAARAAFPNAGWQIVTAAAANPQLGRFLEWLGAYLTLAGLGALLIGGVGVASAIAAYMARKTTTIAILKALGAGSGLALGVLLVEVLALATVGIVAGLALGAAAPFAAAAVVEGVLLLPLKPGLYPQPLALAALFGLMTAGAFALWPVLVARRVPAAALFREGASGEAGRGSQADRMLIALVPLALIGLAVAASDNPQVAAWFVAGAAAAFVLFRLAGEGLAWASRRLARGRPPTLRFALAAIGRRGAPAIPVLLALGLGLTLMVMIVVLDASLRGELTESLPRDAPSFFFLDLQPDQLEPFAALVAAAPEGRIIDRVPALRGRITAIKGVPVDRAVIAPEARWAIQGDRGVTYADRPPPGSRVVAGAWWPADYVGEPLLSIDEGIAHGFAVGIGDHITINVLGREIVARVASLRRIDWESLGMNFTLVLTPAILRGATHTHIATVHVAPGAETGLSAAVADRLPNVSAVAVREVLARVVAVLDQIGLAFRVVAGVTLLVGVVVLAEATAAAQRRRLYEAAILKALGATRGQILALNLAEYALIGLISGVLALFLGSFAAFGLARFLLEVGWTFPGPAVALTVSGGLTATALFGFFASFEARGARPGALLRAA